MERRYGPSCCRERDRSSLIIISRKSTSRHEGEELGSSNKIEEFEAQLASEFAKVEKAKAEADAIVAVYRADAEAAQVQVREEAETAQTRAHWVAKLAKCQSRGETIEEIHARGFDLTEEILKAKELEADVGALASDDDDYIDESKSGSESGEEPDGEVTAPRDNQET
ncbi:uncharacterized protein [Nicotiana tomentosiformis]|uniref:uncharacterized protein n=1 Tax=Nicotiana tomentosiformis TaxID=4098 RepID=UPI00388C4CB5